MSKPKVAAQLYTLRDFTKTAEAFADSIKKVSDIGYTAVQVSAIGPIPHDEVKQICDDNGQTICITHISYDQLWNDIDAVIEQHKIYDCPNVAIGSLPGGYREDGADGYKRFAEEASAVGEKLMAADLTFSYHNHSFEFVRFPYGDGSRSALEIIYDESDPKYLQAEIDTYWIQHGGGDVIYWIGKMKDRMPVIHVKDMVMDDRTQLMAEVGEGNLNWPGILKACEDANVEWLAVEQDICQRDPFESLAISYNNLKAMGYS